ncbi:carboxymuconolactone decarboxylase family protein [Nocardia yunnanensis]|uniref:Carboxymuconolactone decarboxylase family protein n=1 Tax=Nocardia yunnanensis TaxID=2382165 RepID=A0A386Z7L6_9NOCA|nr:carboxymuconolactone decarboxylase family protein [Nocardia yunnanensis]AYF73772.1 carboxymuconolactone decarboxylase family protein [Nocardia yunnanensis]
MTTTTSTYILPTSRLAVDDLAPEMAKALNALERAAQHTTLEKPLRELVKLRVAQINGCVYCVDMHARDAVAGGDTWRRVNLVAVWREAPFFTARERAAFALAEAMTRLADSEVGDQVWRQAAAEFDEKELADLVWHVTLINTWTRLGATARPWTLTGDENA